MTTNTKLYFSTRVNGRNLYDLGNGFFTLLAFGQWYLFHSIEKKDQRKLITRDTFNTIDQVKQRVKEFLLFFGHGKFKIPCQDIKTPDAILNTNKGVQSKYIPFQGGWHRVEDVRHAMC